MKRDWDIIRQILLRAEELPSVADQITPESLNEYDSQEVAYNIWLLNQAGLVEGVVKRVLSGDIAVAAIHSLTWEGHELLDSVRGDTVWSQLKSKAAAFGTDLPFDVVKAMGVQLMQKYMDG